MNVYTNVDSVMLLTEEISVDSLLPKLISCVITHFHSGWFLVRLFFVIKL